MHTKGKHLQNDWAVTLTQLLKQLFVARLDQKVPLKRALLVTAILTLIGIGITAPYLQNPLKAVPNDGHSIWSLYLAIDWAYCGKFSHLSANYEMYSVLTQKNAQQFISSVPSILESTAGSKQAYCATVTAPYLNNENSLFYLFTLIFKTHPNITLAGFGTVLIWIRVAAVTFFLFALICIGASPVFALTLFLVALEIMHVTSSSHLYSLYPFLLPFTAVYAALLTLILHFNLHHRLRSLVVASVVTGLFAGFFYNLRSTYLPVVFLSYLMFLLFVLIERGTPVKAVPMRDRYIRASVALAGFAVGVAILNVICTRPITRLGIAHNRVYHVIGHPLVLGLAIPENELSKREGIEWNDAIGGTIARRVDPNATYLGPTYEQAMLTYYWGLWKRYPREMVSTYLTKWRMSSTGSLGFVYSNMTRPSKLLFLPDLLLSSGIDFTGAAVALILAAAYIGRQFRASAGMMMAAIGVPVFLITLESAVIMSGFYITYHNALLFGLFFINLTVFQAGANGIFRRVTRKSEERTRVN